MKSVEQQILQRIYGKGRGWAFSPTDFSALATREAVDLGLHRLHGKGTIRRVIRGIYDYPRTSSLLGQTLSPDLDAVAQALARKFGWRILPSGATALNLMGLSTQVPGRYLYLSDGPDRAYQVGNMELAFQHTALKEAGFKLKESALLVHGLKALGLEHVNEDVKQALRAWLRPELRGRVLADTRTVTGWVAAILHEVCREDSRG